MLVGCEQSGSDSIGPRGGEVISPDGRLTLTIPEGALDHEVEIEISDAADRPDGALGPAYSLSPRGTAFRIPATITFELEEGDMEAGDPAIAAARDGQWFYLADREVDSEDMIVTSSATYLSDFAVVAWVGTGSDDEDHDHDHDHGG